MHEWLDELRLEPGPPYSTMGTHALDLDDWLIIDERRGADLALKAILLDAERNVVFSALPSADDACSELLEVVTGWLRARQIDVAAPGHDHPAIEAAKLVQEDLAVLQRIDGSWMLTAGAVCFPTHWSVVDKIGLSLAGIHEPVAHYESELRERVDRFHDRLTTERPIWRRNWFVVPTSELFLPGSPKAHGAIDRIDADGSPMWIRSERQTLRRLPETDAIVFTIRVQQAPLGVLCERPEIAGRMLASARSWDSVKRAYTSTGGALDALIEWLDDVSGGTS